MSPERKRHPRQENKDLPTKHTAIIYPGQGTQYVGMGEEPYRQFARVRRIYDATDKIFSDQYPEAPTVSSVSFYGPQETLMDTYYTQGAIFAHNHACGEMLKKFKESDFIAPLFTLGHSLGEYNSLVRSEAIRFKDGLRLVRARARAMQMANEISPGGLRVLRLSESDERLRELTYRYNDIEISSINGLNQVVVGGTNVEFEKAEKWMRENGIASTALRVRGAFHTKHMKPAVGPFYEELKSIRISHPSIPIIGNTTASILREPEEIKEELINHFTKPVLWLASSRYIFEHGVTRTLEIASDQGILSRFNQQLNQGGVIESIKGLFTRYDKSLQSA